jgi:hypothetical protein
MNGFRTPYREVVAEWLEAKLFRKEQTKQGYDSLLNSYACAVARSRISFFAYRTPFDLLDEVGKCSDLRAPPEGFEPPHTVPETDALSPELRRQGKRRAR